VKSIEREGATQRRVEARNVTSRVVLAARFLPALSVARRVDVYANCFVKRDHATKTLQPSKPADLPQNSLRLSDFDGEQDASRDSDASANDEEIF
jgi:hypothetical protein